MADRRRLDDRLMPDARTGTIPRWLVLLCGILILVAISGLIWLGARSGGDRSDGTVPVIEGAAPDQIKQEPEIKGGMSVPHQNTMIYGDEEEGEIEHLLPSHEEPLQQDEIAQLIQNEGVVYDPQPAPQSAPEPKEPEIVELPVEQAAPAPEPKAQLTPAPAPKPEPKPEPQPEPKPEPKVKAEPQAAPQPAEVKVYRGDWRLQLAAFSSQAGAQKAWQNLKKNRATVLADLGPYYDIVKKADGKSLYRLQVGPFKSRVHAQQRCDRLKATGQDCYVVAPGK